MAGFLLRFSLVYPDLPKERVLSCWLPKLPGMVAYAWEVLKFLMERKALRSENGWERLSQLILSL